MLNKKNNTLRKIKKKNIYPAKYLRKKAKKLVEFLNNSKLDINSFFIYVLIDELGYNYYESLGLLEDIKSTIQIEELKFKLQRKRDLELINKS